MPNTDNDLDPRLNATDPMPLPLIATVVASDLVIVWLALP
jgi:hypothetical protein